MDPIVKAIVNNLRCPICKSQIDGSDMKGYRNDRSTMYNFYCASDSDDYRFWMPCDDGFVRIQYDMVDVYEGKYKFRIDQRYLINRTKIDIWEVDPERNLIEEKSKEFTYQQILFDYRNTNREKIVSRIKTILTFQ